MTIRDSVRAAAYAYQKRFEGEIAHFYLDILGLVTIAIGVLVDRKGDPNAVSLASGLPLRRADGSLATWPEIAADWRRVKDATRLAQGGAKAASYVAQLRLDADGLREVFDRKLDAFLPILERTFPDLSTWPAEAQLALLGVAWGAGPSAFLPTFPRLTASLRVRDFATAAAECSLDAKNNPGVIPRNAANRALLLNAGVVEANGLDPDAITWPSAVTVGDDQPIVYGIPDPPEREL